MSPKQKWGFVALYGAAMGYLEAAVVYYLRTLVDRIQPHQPDPLPNIPALSAPELLREGATLLMLLAVGCLAGRNSRSRFGFILLAFGVWDITYYLFLVPLSGWPRSILDWDILFLLPLPWWGPILAPVSIALLMITFGILATVLEQGEPPIWPGTVTKILATLGILIALGVFMSDAIAALPRGPDGVRTVLPQSFLWAPFAAAWILIATAVIDMGWQLATRYR